MYRINEDNSIYATRGDIVILSVSANKNGKPYTFQAGEVLRIKVFGKKDAESVVLQKDFPITTATQTVELFLDENDTKIGEVISKPRDYWYEIELNPFDNPQTIIGYDEDGPKIFRLFPEGADIPPYVPNPEDIPVIDTELDMTSDRPVANQVIARAFSNLQAGYQATHEAVSKLHITPQMYGAVGDGKADDTEAIKFAIAAIGKNGISTLHFPTGTYLVSEDIPLVSNITVTGDGYNSVIKRIANDLESYNTLVCNGIENVLIKNIHIQGDRYEHTGTEGEWGMCIGLQDSKQIIIEHCKLSDAWGDGVYVGTSLSGTGDGCKDITVDNCIIDYCRRNGISVIECDGFRLRNSKITNTDGTSPKAGIDFEANNGDQAIKNCLVENCVFSGNLIDIAFYDRSAVHADIRNCSLYSKYGLQYDSVILEEKATTGGVTVINCNFANLSNCYLSNRKHINSVPVRFIGCVFSCDTVAIQLGGVSLSYPYNMGDLHFIDCYIAKSPHNTGWMRYQNTETSYPLQNVTLYVRLGDGVLYHNFYTNVNYCELEADIKCRPKIYAENHSIDKYNTEPLICIDTRQKDIEISLAHSIPFGMPITVRKLYPANKVYIKNLAEKFGQFDYADKIEFSGRFTEAVIVHQEPGVWRVIGNSTCDIEKSTQ